MMGHARPNTKFTYGREAKIRKNNRIVLQYGKHRHLHQGVNDNERPI